MDNQDVYVEYLVKRAPDGITMLKKAGIVAGILIIPLVFMMIQAVSFLSPFVFALCVWGGVRLYKLLSVEYEYIVTNGELDVDIILGQAKRKRLLTVDSRSFEMFAPMTKEHERDYSSQTIRKTFDAASSKDAENRWFAIFNGRDGVRTLLILEYNERVVKSMKPFIPRRAFSDR